MLLLNATLLTLLLPQKLKAAAPGKQSPLHPTFDPTNGRQEHIAIVGAGIGGASAAFNIHELNRNRPPQKVTIFEKEYQTGGRVQTVYLYPGVGGSKVIEDGASSFFTDDWCLSSGMQDVGLTARELPKQRKSSCSSQWPGHDGRGDVKCNTDSASWQEYLRRIWRHGPSWRLLHSSVQSTLRKWKLFGHPGRRSFKDIARELTDIGLLAPGSNSARSHLGDLNVTRTLQDEVIQPCSRARLSLGLPDISGLSALIAVGRTTTTSVDGGNSRLIDRMIKISGADLQLGSRVHAIVPGFSRRYRLLISSLAPNGSSQADAVEFDAVILATPLIRNEIDIGSLKADQTSPSTPWIETHVTHFSSPVAASSNLSVLPLEICIQDEMARTTSTTIIDPNLLSLYRFSACFRRGCLLGDECDQCDKDEILYRVHSRQHIGDRDIARMIGQDWREKTQLSDYGVHFVRRTVWPYSFPKRSERHQAFVNEIEIAPNLFYLNGAESVVSSMEMSCRMGRNVAREVTGSSILLP